MSEELTPKYENLEKMSRAERDNAIFQQLEIMSNELARLSRTIAEIKNKV
jgi:hypothetical protein